MNTWGGKQPVVIKYHPVLPPGCLSFIMLDFIKKYLWKSLRGLASLWPLLWDS